MKAARPTPWEWLERLGLLSGLVMLAAGQILASDTLAWAALVALVVGYVGRLVTLRRGAQEDPTKTGRLDSDSARGCAVFGLLVAIAASLVAALIGLSVALFRDRSVLDGAGAGARAVLILAAAVSALLVFEHFVTRPPSAR